MEEPELHEVALAWLVNVVRECNEQKQKHQIDPERFTIETTFNHLIQDVYAASLNENGPIPLSADD